MSFEQQLTAVVAEARRRIPEAHDLASAERLEKEFIGRKGKLTTLLRQVPTLSSDLRPRFGGLANAAKKELDAAFRQLRLQLQQASGERAFDSTLPGLRPVPGTVHPLTQTIRRLVAIFQSMGFEIVEGPEVEDEKYNFDLLNIPQDHPARDLQDTFYVGGKGRVLRTHTSPVQLRAMHDRRPPVRLIVPGRVYRHEATDASHEAAFFQCEGLVIDKGVRLTDLFGTIDAVLKSFFGSGITTRAQASYFPFVEPGAEIAMSCLICKGTGCSVCKQSGWLEMMGCGMVHPTVLKNMKVDPKEYSGFAFGMGVDRLMMLSYGIDDIRLSYAGDLRFLQQFA